VGWPSEVSMTAWDDDGPGATFAEGPQGRACSRWSSGGGRVRAYVSRRERAPKPWILHVDSKATVYAWAGYPSCTTPSVHYTIATRPWYAKWDVHTQTV